MNAWELRDSIVRRLAAEPGAMPLEHWQYVVGDVRRYPGGDAPNWSISLFGTLADRLATAHAAFEVQKEYPLIEP